MPLPSLPLACTDNIHAATARTGSPALPPSLTPSIDDDTLVGHQAARSPVRKPIRSEHLLSPEIARLPPPHTPTSVHSQLRDTSSEYYTAAWGSPYELSPSLRSARTAFSEQFGSEEVLGSSPEPEFGLEHLVPSRLGGLKLEQPVVSPLSKSGRSGTQEELDLTPRSRAKRWVQLPRRQEPLPKAHGWTDKSDHDVADHGSKRRRRRASSGSLEDTKRQSILGHRSRESNRTLDQQSFWADLREKRAKDMSGLFASRWAATPPAEVDAVIVPMHKEAPAGLYASRWAETPPLADPNLETDDGEKRVEASNDKHDEQDGLEEVSAREVSRALNPTTDLVGTPTNDGADDAADRSAKKLAAEEKNAEVTTPPKVTKPILFSSPTKSRLDVPRVKRKVNWKGKTCVIQIPSVDYQALGHAMPMTVSEVQERFREFEEAGYDTSGFDLASESSEDGPAHVKPIFPDEAEIQVMSVHVGRKVRLYDPEKWRTYMDWLTEQKLAALGVSIGPEEPTNVGMQDKSRQSSGQYPPLPFSPPIPSNSAGSMGRPGVVRGHSHNMTVASPISPLNGPFGHMHRHSTFTGPLGFQQVPQPSQQPSIQGMRSFSPLGQHLGQQTAITGLQPFSPRTQFALPQYNRTGSSAQVGPFRNGHGVGQVPASPLSQQVDGPATRETTRSADQSGYFPLFQQPDEKERLNAQAISALEPQTEQPSSYIPPHKRAHLNENIAVPTPRGHQHNISEGFERDVIEAERRHEADKLDYIEVVEYSTTDDSARSSSARQRVAPTEKDPLPQGHSHKKTTSRFNVAAPTFKFNPRAPTLPTSTTFTFGDHSQQSTGRSPVGHSRQKSSGAFNVDAPEFRPAGTSSVPRSEFNFSTNGPSFKPFKPDAPAFQPTKQPGTNVIDQLPAIFGKVEIPDIVKPARRSKALPIVRPNQSSQSSSESEFEDEEGRLAQSEDRMKRQRKGGDDGDEVPRFAEPTPMPDLSEFAPKSQPAEGEEQQLLPDVAEGGPTDTQEIVDPVVDPNSDVSDVEQSGVDGSFRKHQPSSSLSALAKPFEPWMPSEAEYVSANEPEQSFASISDLEDGESKENEHPRTSAQEDHEQSFLSDRIEDEYTPVISQALPTLDQPASARVDNVAIGEPSYDEIDAVMRQLNDMDAEHDAADRDVVADVADVSPLSTPEAHPLKGPTYLPEWTRSDAPSPSPRRQQLLPNPQGDSSFTVHDRTSSGEIVMNGWPHPTRLNKVEDLPASDWSGEFSAQEEEKLQQRGQFFDNHIENLIGKAVESRLQPLEQSLRSLHNVVTKRSISQDLALKRSSSTIESDADDEDDLSEAQRHRPISRGRDKRFDQVKIAVLEALREQSPRRQSQSSHDLHELHQILQDMKMSFARAASTKLELEDIRAVIEDVISGQGQALTSSPIDEASQDVSHKRELSEMENRMNETLAGALEEANHRRGAEQREAAIKRELELAEEELQLFRLRLQEAEDAQRDMENKVEGLEAENTATYATLEEYRMSSHKWRQDLDQASLEREDLENTIAGLGGELEESQELGNSMRRRLEKLHSDMATAAGQLASEKASWKSKEEEYRSRCERLEAQQSANLEDRSTIDAELRTLRTSALEAAEARGALDQLRTSNAALEATVHKLQNDFAEQQALAIRYERDFNDAREAGRAEVQRTRLAMEADVEAANHQVNSLRAELESQLDKVREELMNVKSEAETAKVRHEHLLEEEDHARREALRKVNLASSVALDETRQKHEASIQELQSGHSRALRHALEDKERSEHFLNERLALSDEKLQHFQDRVLHLEERLEVAKSAAQAAAMSAQSKTVMVPAAGHQEKVSPQALRESIVVLQEQLQDRESRIESMQNQREQQTSTELKKRDDEIAWLRELLTVRSEELTDLINTLARPTFDRGAVRDTAIRLRTNLQMEQQEKERAGQNVQSLPGQAIASLSNFAAPAFHKWRANMESSALRNAPRGNARPRANTPSKPASSDRPILPHGYNSGLMTPPASNLRSTPSPEVSASLPQPRLHPRSGNEYSMPVTARPGPGSRQPSTASDAPTTPLFRSQSYDKDAEDNSTHLRGFEDDDLEIPDNKPPAFRSLGAELDAAEDDGME